MTPPIFVGDLRQRANVSPLPGWFVRDMGERLFEPTPRRRWRLPIWPGFRLALRILPASGVDHV